MKIRDEKIEINEKINIEIDGYEETERKKIKFGLLLYGTTINVGESVNVNSIGRVEKATCFLKSVFTDAYTIIISCY